MDELDRYSGRLEIRDNEAWMVFSQPHGDRKKCEEMENSLTRQKPCARQSSRIASDKMFKGGPFVGLTFSKKRRRQRASGRWTAQEGAHTCIRCKISSRGLATCRVNS